MAVSRMKSKKTKRLAVVGAGLIGKRHIQAISRISHAELSGLVDPEESVAELAASHAVPWFQDIEGMLEAGLPDGVIIASPNQLHVDHGMQCVRANVPILVEKPIDSDVQSAKRLVEEAEVAGVPVLVGHHRRHNPIVREAKAKLDGGAIGSIVAVSAMCWLYKPDEYFDVEWRTRQGAGPVFINLIHDIDLLRYFCGEIISVQALQSNRSRGFKVEDTAAITMRFQSGALAAITVSDTIVAPWSWELTSGENSAYPKTAEACYLVGGTQGSLEIPSGKIWANSSKRSWFEPIQNHVYEVDGRDPLDLQIGHFCRVIAREEEPLVSGREGLRTLQVIEAIKKSSESGMMMQINGG